MRAGGPHVVTLAAPKSKAGDPKAANKRLTPDGIRLFWRATGKDLERAEVDGNAELLVEPAQASPTADRKRLFARRFDCDFYEAGNLARVFTATGGAKAVVEPLQPTEQKGTRTLTSDTMARSSDARRRKWRRLTRRKRPLHRLVKKPRRSA